MIHFAITENPFDAAETTERYEALHGESVGSWLAKNKDKWDHLKANLICVYNGEKVEPDQLFNTFPEDDDFVVITPQPSGAVAWVVVAVAVAVATYLAFSLFTPKIPSTDQATPVYSLQGKSNQSKLNSPIERCYGKVRMWPSYAATPYNTYIDNDQYQYQLFCLGHGTIDISTCTVQIEDTAIDDLEDAEYEIYLPGEKTNLFPDNVNTVVEVSNIQIYGTGHDDYPSPDGWYGGFPLCGSGETVYKAELDITNPQGLSEVDSDGDQKSEGYDIEIEFREIDDLGDPVGSWFQTHSQKIQKQTTQSVNITFDYTFPTQARYEVRIRRVDIDEGHNPKKTDGTYWSQARGFRTSTQDYGDLTMLAVKLRANNAVNDQSSRRINVIGTWKTEVYDGTEWSLQTNRSIVWAFVDVFRAKYGAQAADDYLNLCNLMNLDVEFYEQGKTFDWIFDQKTTVWEAAKIIARVGRATPIPQGIKVSMKIDKPQAVMNHMFTPRNILKDSLTRQISLAKPEQYDGVTIEYTDPTSYLPEQIDCLLGSDLGEKPNVIILAGCTDRDLAYREGLYIRATELFQRENVTFQTGLEGRPVKYGDLIGVSHDTVLWDQSGYITNISGSTITLSQDVEFGAGIHRIILKDKLGGGEIYEVTAGSEANEVIASTTPDNAYPVNDYVEYQSFAFGELEKEVRLYKVVQVKPVGGDKVSVTAVEYTDDIYVYDSEDAPELDKGSIPPTIPDRPSITGLQVQTSKTQILVAYALWQPALGADYYIFQKSFDGISWEEEIVVSNVSYQFPVTKNTTYYIRVRGVGKLYGAWATWDGILGTANITPADPTGFALKSPWVSETVTTKWFAANLADEYQITVLETPSDTQIIQETTELTEHSFNITDVLAVSTPQREYKIRLVAQNSVGDSDNIQEITINNSAPAAITGISHSIASQNSEQVVIQVVWSTSSAQDLDEYRLWVSEEEGFTPSGANLVFFGSSNVTNITIEKNANGNYPTTYYRVAAKDVWGDDVNYSAEQTITGTQVTLIDDEDNILIDDEGNILTN